VAFLDDMTVGAALDLLVRHGAHHHYIDGFGRYVAQERNLGINTSPIASFDNFFYGLDYNRAVEGVYNNVFIESEPRRAATSVQTVAFMNDIILINSAQEVQFFLGFKDPTTGDTQTPVGSLVTPVNSQDYYLSRTADGTGTNVTSLATIAVSAFALTALCKITNTTTGDMYLNRFQLRGYPYPRNPKMIANQFVSSSQLLYGGRVFTLSDDLIDQFAHANSYAAYIANKYKDPRPDLSFTQKN